MAIIPTSSSPPLRKTQLKRQADRARAAERTAAEQEALSQSRADERVRWEVSGMMRSALHRVIVSLAPGLTEKQADFMKRSAHPPIYESSDSERYSLLSTIATHPSLAATGIPSVAAIYARFFAFLSTPRGRALAVLILALSSLPRPTSPPSVWASHRRLPSYQEFEGLWKEVVRRVGRDEDWKLIWEQGGWDQEELWRMVESTEVKVPGTGVRWRALDVRRGEEGSPSSRSE